MQLLVGPRQVGKTTLLLECAQDLGDRAIYVAGDDPTMLLPQAWIRLWDEVRRRATDANARVVVILDEVHHWPDWAARLTRECDQLDRDGVHVQIIASTSSVGTSARSATRAAIAPFDFVAIGHWSASVVASVFDVDPADAAEALVAFGGYPGAYQFMVDRPRWSAFVRESIIDPAIGRDLLSLSTIRQPALLRQLFAVAAQNPCEIISLQRIQGVLLQRGALATIANYLRLLEDAGLVAALERFSPRRKRLRAAPPKLVVLNNALISALHPNGPPDRAREPERHGKWIENACLAHAINAGQRVTYWREEPFEVSGVMEGGWGQWAVEVKTNPHTSEDYRGLREFGARYPDHRPLVITSEERLPIAARAGVTAMTWQQFLLGGPPRSP